MKKKDINKMILGAMEYANTQAVARLNLRMAMYESEANDRGIRITEEIIKAGKPTNYQDLERVVGLIVDRFGKDNVINAVKKRTGAF